MMAALGFATIAVLLALILWRKMTPLGALVLAPVAASLAAGFGAKTAAFMVKGMQSVAGVAGMFVFAILYFGVMTDAGMLDPIIDRILRFVGTNPARIVVGTAMLALLVHLDGSGAVTFLVTVPVMLPLYQRLGMDPRVLACAASLAAGVNFLPWTGPMIRAAASLHLTTAAIFNPLLPVQAVGLAFVFGCAWWMGRSEARRLGLTGSGAGEIARHHLTPDEAVLRRPGRFAINLALTLLMIAGMTAGKLDAAAVFLVGLAVALPLNYPDLKIQRERIDAHARAALLMAAILLAAGAFTGILRESGMLSAMAKAAVAAAPAGAFGVAPVQMAQAAVLGQMTTGFPVSPLTPATFLIVGLAGIELRDHQRFAFPYLFGASILMTIAAVLVGVLPL